MGNSKGREGGGGGGGGGNSITLHVWYRGRDEIVAIGKCILKL